MLKRSLNTIFQTFKKYKNLDIHLTRIFERLLSMKFRIAIKHESLNAN